jgi:Leucine-rich repeat (LRR) protein
MAEKYGFFLLLVGAALSLAALVWLMARAFRTHVAWGLGCLLFPPLAIVFSGLHFRKASAPLGLLLVGALIVGGTVGANHFLANYVDLGARERIVAGERHLTLTGWDGADYSVLQSKPDTVVLQMANPDVTDAPLEYLQGMSQLRELDLNDTQVTDAGLSRLKSLPALQILRLRKTKVSDQAFREYLAGNDTLLELDLRETSVASKTLREWKTQQKDRRRYLR